MTPTPRGEVDDLLEPEESWPERTMLRLSSAKECLATESAQSKIDETLARNTQHPTRHRPTPDHARSLHDHAHSPPAPTP
jgi:hypothetical protein